MRRQYDAIIAAYHSRHQDVIRPDGTQNCGNAWAGEFWRGYNGIPRKWDRDSRESTGYACYRAGQDVRKSADPSALIPKPQLWKAR